MVETMRLSTKVIDDIPQAAPSGELSQPQGNELAPAGHLPQFPASMVLEGQRLEVMSRNHFEKLGKHGMLVGHGLVFPFGYMGLSQNLIVPKEWRPSHF